MYNDTNPSFVCALFGLHRENEELIKDLHGRNGMRIRELRILDISMPMDKRYDDNINYIKHFAMPMLKRFVDVKFPFKNKIISMLQKQTGLKMLKYKVDWKTDRRHKFLYTGFTPLAFDNKYLKFCETETERKNFKKAETFSSDNYKPKVNGKNYDADLIFKEELLK